MSKSVTNISAFSEIQVSLKARCDETQNSDFGDGSQTMNMNFADRFMQWQQIAPRSRQSSGHHDQIPLRAD
jgi:hypothetical protein